MATTVNTTINNSSTINNYHIDNNYKQNHMLKVFLIALGISFCIFLPFIIKDNGAFTYFGDFDVQQVPFYMLCHDAIRSGEFGFNWFTDLGVNFIGSYSFYTLGSPFFWLTIPFPNYFLPYLMAPLLMIKFALTAVTGYSYIKLFVKNPNMAVIGGLLYSFSGFNIYNIFFNHFQEVVLFFPLLLIGIEDFVREGKRYKFALAVFICCLVNYYFFFGQVIFCVIYFLVRLQSKDFYLDMKKFLQLALESVMGLLMASFLLVPALMALMGNPRTGDYIEGYNTLIYAESQRYGLIISSLFFPPDIPARPNFFPDSNAKWSSVSLFLPLFSTTGVFAFFKYKSNHFIKTILKISIVIAFVPILNATFSALNYSYYARWFYMPILLMSLATVLVIEQDMRNLKYGLKMTAMFVFYFSLIGVMPKKIGVGEYEWFALPEFKSRFWMYVLFSVCGLVSVLFLIALRKSKHLYKIITICLSLISIGYSMYMIDIGRTHGEGYDRVMTNGHNANIQLPVTLDDEFYRIDTFDEIDNLAMFYNLPSINTFHSVVPASIMEYYILIDGDRNVASRPEPNEIGVRSLNNVLYSFVREDKIKDVYNEKPLLGFDYIDTQHGYAIYENQYFIPFGVGYDNQITHEQLEQSGNLKDRILINGVYLGFDENGDEYSILPTLVPKTDDQSFLYDEEYLLSCKNLSQNYLQKLEYNSNGFSGVYNALRNQVLFFSLPYDKGFTATLNGEPIEILKANGGFMAIPVETGINKVEFKYETPGLSLGIKISIFALILFVVYIYITKRCIKTLSFDEELEDIGVVLNRRN